MDIPQKAGKNYLEYHAAMARVNILILHGDETTALEKFDSVFQTFSYLFGRHTYLGLQLAGKLQNENLGYQYLYRAFATGITRKVIEADTFISQLAKLNPQRWQLALSQYDSIHTAYTERLKTPLKKTIDSLYEYDQYLTQKLNTASVFNIGSRWVRWNRCNKRHIKLLRKLIAANGYPGERLMGISTLEQWDTDSLHQINYGFNCFISYHQTLYMLIHYFSKNREDFNAELLPQVQAGNMSAYEYAVVNDFMASLGKRKYRTHFFNAWHRAPANLEKFVNENRRSIGLCDLATEKEYQRVWKSQMKQRTFKTIFLPDLL